MARRKSPGNLLIFPSQQSSHRTKVCRRRIVREQSMAQSPRQVFSGITPSTYTKLTEKARASGIELSGNSGTASKFGVEVAWNYVPETEQLTFQCLKTPFFISADDVHRKLQTLVQQTLASL
jgi:hypothetical protein